MCKNIAFSCTDYLRMDAYFIQYMVDEYRNTHRFLDDNLSFMLKRDDENHVLPFIFR